MPTAIDLFAGLGGWSTGARMAGVRVLWAANHWPDAVTWHAANHLGTLHVCQDLQQADWTQVPAHDVLLASPCCQGHSRARGKGHGNPQHDASRATAWAVIAALEMHRPPLAVVENVPEFLRWALFPAWADAATRLGYALSPHVVDCADLGVPQNRERVFIVLSRSAAPLRLSLPRLPHVPARGFLNLDGPARWSPVNRQGRAAATLARIAEGRRVHGDLFLTSYYGNSTGGRSLDRPIGTITTRDRWAVIRGEHMRMLSADEALAAMSFPPDTARPASHTLTVHLAGNAVPPVAAAAVLAAMQEAA